MLALGLGGLNGFNLTGDGLVLLSAVSAGAGALVSRIYTPGRDPMLLTGWQLLIGGCFLLGVGTMRGGALGRVTLGGVLLLGYMIVLSAAAFTIWTALLGKFPVGKVSLFGFLIPVFGTLFSRARARREYLHRTQSGGARAGQRRYCGRKLCKYEKITPQTELRCIKG